eukprot:1393108-Amorphochlora_amoeboformis.AAC.1
MQGGQRGFCAKHGGLPYCRENGCTARQSYKSGGVRGFCAKHGGHPVCEGGHLRHLGESAVTRFGS